MNFTSPLNLFWLLPLLGGIIALWILRMRRRDHTVSSLFLWRDVTAVRKADTPFQKLRNNLLLILQLLAAILLIMALSGPVAPHRQKRHQTIVVVVDNSVSMSATDVAPSRLAHARSQALGFVADHDRAGDDVCIVATSPRPHVVSAWDEPIRDAASAITNVSGTDVPRDLPGSLAMVVSLLDARHDPDSRIALFSDGAWSTDQDVAARIAAKGYSVAIATAGTDTASNTGIVSIVGRADPASPGRQRVLARIRDFGTAPVHAGKAVITVDGVVKSTVPLSINHGEYQNVAISVADHAGPVKVNVSLTGLTADALASDNSASIILPASRKATVLLVSAGNIFLERALGADTSIDLFECSPAQAEAAMRARAFDAVVFDDYLPATLPIGRYLVFHATNSAMPVTVSAAAAPDSPTIVDWNDSHPVMRFVDFSGVHIASSTNASPLRWGRSLVETDSGPAVVVGDKDGSRIAWVSFSLGESDFPLKVAFPVFIQNAVGWLLDSEGQAKTFSTGDPLPTMARGQWRVRGPLSSLSGTCDPSAPSTCQFTDTSHVGLYDVSNGSSRSYAVNVLSEAASDVVPREHPGLIFAARTVSVGTTTSRLPLAAQIAALALVLLLAEWVAFHRRT